MQYVYAPSNLVSARTRAVTAAVGAAEGGNAHAIAFSVTEVDRLGTGARKIIQRPKRRVGGSGNLQQE